MPLTVEQAIDQIQKRMKEKGKFNIGNLLDSFIGVAMDNSADLQAMLDKLLTKKGILTAEEEKKLQELLRIQEQEKKKRQQIRTKNALIIGGIVAATGTILFLVLKKKQKI